MITKLQIKNFLGISEVEITPLEEDTPEYKGDSDLVKFGNRYFRTRDAEGYSSKLLEIKKEEYKKLLKFKK